MTGEREGKILVCSSCGAEVLVVKDCHCPCGFVCCDAQMEEKS